MTRFVTPDGGSSLAEAPAGERLRITRVDVEGEGAAWLGAVGLDAGEELVVLRRAAFGGPLHVRTDSGGEFAVGRDVALKIIVEIASPETAQP